MMFRIEAVSSRMHAVDEHVCMSIVEMERARCVSTAWAERVDTQRCS
ncbi:Hypothetical protein A7982_01396 [Minicystis rosea]|nr:Hypothetical protein A7982_01396 [Minicystis rosea]